MVGPLQEPQQPGQQIDAAKFLQGGGTPTVQEDRGAFTFGPPKTGIWDVEPSGKLDPVAQKKLRGLDSSIRSFRSELDRPFDIRDKQAGQARRRLRSKLAQAAQARDFLLREQKRDRQSVFENALDDGAEMVTGLVGLYKDVVIPSAVEIFGSLDWLSEMDADDVSEGIADTGELMLKGLADTVTKWEDPKKALRNHPVESLLDLSALAAITGKTLQLAGRGAELAGIPTTIARDSAQLARIQQTLLRARSQSTVNAGRVARLERGAAEARIFSLEATGDAVAKFPFEALQEAVAARTVALREASPVADKLASFFGVTPRAREVNRLASEANRKKAILRQEFQLRELRKLGLTPEESKVVWFESVGMRQLLEQGDNIVSQLGGRLETIFKDVLAQRTPGGQPSLAARLRGGLPAAREEFAPLIRFADELPPQRRALVDRAREIIIRDNKVREELLAGAGILPDEQAQRAKFFFLANQLIDVRSERAGVITDLIRIADDIDLRPEYLPVVMANRKTRLEMLLDRLLSRGTGERLPNLKQFERESLLTLKRLLDETDERGLPRFRTNVDEISFRNAVSATELVATKELLKKIEISDGARRLRVGDELGPNEVLFTSDPFLTSARRKLLTQEAIAEHFRGVGSDEVNLAGLVREWPEISKKILPGIRDDLDKLLTSGREFFAIPRDTATALARHMRGTNEIMQVMFDGPLGWWKQVVLLYNPGWYMQNIVGNVMLTAMAGFGALDQTRSMLGVLSKRINKVIPKEVLGQIFDDTARVGRELVLREKGLVGRTMGLISNPPVSGGLGKMANAIENFSRKSAFLSFTRRRLREWRKADASAAKSFKSVEDVLKAPRTGKIGKLIDDAIKDVNEHLFDYGNLHPFERQVMRRVFPFWTWVRNSNLLLGRAFGRAFGAKAAPGAALPIAERFKTLAYQRLAKLSFDLIDDQDLPPWLKQSMLIGGYENGDMLFFNLRRYNPFFAIGPAAVGLQSVNPFIKVAYERVSGKNVWTEQPFKAQERSFLYSGRVVKLNPETGRLTEEPFLPPVLTHVLDQFPQHHWLNQIVNNFMQTDEGNLFQPAPVRDLRGKPRFEREPLFNILTAAGLPFQQVERDSIRSMRLQKLRFIASSVRELRRQMRRAQPDQRQLYVEAIRDLLADRRKWVEIDKD